MSKAGPINEFLNLPGPSSRAAGPQRGLTDLQRDAVAQVFGQGVAQAGAWAGTQVLSDPRLRAMLEQLLIQEGLDPTNLREALARFQDMHGVSGEAGRLDPMTLALLALSQQRRERQVGRERNANPGLGRSPAGRPAPGGGAGGGTPLRQSPEYQSARLGSARVNGSNVTRGSSGAAEAGRIAPRSAGGAIEIGRTGNTGTSTGPHLDIRVKDKNGKLVDPRPIINELAEHLEVGGKKLSDYRVSSGYGMRRHPVHGTRKMHHGVDFAIPNGTPIRYRGEGQVTAHKRPGQTGGGGNVTELTLPSGHVVQFLHLKSHDI